MKKSTLTKSELKAIKAMALDLIIYGNYVDFGNAYDLLKSSGIIDISFKDFLQNIKDKVN